MFDLPAVQEAIRAQVAILQEQAKQVGLARWRAEKLLAKVAELKKDKQGALAVVPAELEANRARADLGHRAVIARSIPEVNPAHHPSAGDRGRQA